MAIRNVFGAQSIRQKLLLGTLFLAIIPVAVTSVIVGRESLSSGRDALEAQAFAYLAVRTLKGLPITFPTTTGVSRPMTGGILAAANRSG